MSEEHSNKNEKTTLYAAAIAIVVALAALGYAAMQGDSFAKRITQSEQKQTAALAKLDKIDAFAAKLDAFEKQLSVRLADLEVALTAYYDSDCEFCDNEKLFKVLDGIEPELKNKGITLKRVDVRGDYDKILESGIDRVPAFFATGTDLLKEPSGRYLQDVMDQWAMAGFDAYNAQGGIALTPRTVSEMLTPPCLSDKTNVEYFYSETCQYCKRVNYANGTIANPASDPKFKDVLEESLQKIEGENAELEVTKRCLAVHSGYDNYASVKVNKSDAELCVESQGEEKTAADAQAASKYHLQPPTAPLFVVNCRYLFSVKATTPDAITEPICAFKPSLQFCKTSATPSATPPVPSPASSPQPSA